jgi:hypothetical protein
MYTECRSIGDSVGRLATDGRDAHRAIDPGLQMSMGQRLTTED